MLDPFSIATDAIFSTSMAVSGILLDTNENIYNVRCVIKESLTMALQSYTAQVPEIRTLAILSKKGIKVDKDVFYSLHANDKIYKFDGVYSEDEYTFTFYVNEV